MDDSEGLTRPGSPQRFRRRDHSSVESTPTKNTSSNTKEHSNVRFELPEDDEDDSHILPPNSPIHPTQPTTSTPNPATTAPSRTQQRLDEEADSFDSAKSLISAYQTPLSPSRGTPNRFRRNIIQTPAPIRNAETPSKLLRTLSRATSVTPGPPLDSHLSVFHTPFPERTEDDGSLDEAEKTLDSIIESADDASQRIRKVLEESRQQRVMRQSLSPSQDTPGDRMRMSEDTEDREEEPVEMSIWGEKSFFRRMASRAPGGWAFTPQPKFRTVDVDVNEEDVENVDPGKVCRLK